MFFTINGKDYPVYFSIAGIDYLDRQYYIDANGVKFGFGVGILSQQLAMKSPVALYHGLKAGLINKGVKDEYIESFIDNMAREDKLGKVCNEVLEELKKQPLTRETVKSLISQAPQVEEIKEEKK